jgi:integrase
MVAQTSAVFVTPALAAWPEKTPRWRVALEQYLHTLDSDATRATYRRCVRAFFETPGAPDLPQLTRATLVAYREHLMQRAGLRELVDAEGQSLIPSAPTSARKARLAPETIKLRLAALRAFLIWVRRERGSETGGADWLAADLSADEMRYRLRAPRGKVERPYAVLDSASQRAALLDAARAEAYHPERAEALVALALGGGLRVAELCRVRVGDLRRDGLSAYVWVQGKGQRERVVPLAAEVYALLVRFILASGRRPAGAYGAERDAEAPLFLSRKRQRGATPKALETAQARRIVASVVARARLADTTLSALHLTPHALRHDYAINLLRGNAEEGRESASVVAVSKLLGHAGVGVTMRYVNHLQRGELSAYAPTLGLQADQGQPQ